MGAPFLSGKTVRTRNYWLEVYWPAEPGLRVGRDQLLYLYYHTGKLNVDAKIRKGDRVLFYETGSHPDEEWLGGKCIFASGEVAGSHDEPMAHNRSGGRLWTRCRRVRVRKTVPPAAGVPLSVIRRNLGWSRRSALRRGPISLTKGEFESLETVIKTRARLVRVGGANGRGKPRQPDIGLRLRVERVAMSRAAAWYRKRGYAVEAVHRQNLGWDLKAIGAGGELFVEVKGLSGPRINVGLTPNEYKKMRRKSIRGHYRIFVVTNALGRTPVDAEFFYSRESKGWFDLRDRRLIFDEVLSANAHI